MKRKLTAVYSLFWALTTACLFSSFFFNPPQDNYTGSPGANTCSSTQGGCHSCGTCGTGNVTISGLPASITPNTAYSIVVTVTRTNTIPQLGGFQMVALDGNNDNVGTLSDPGASSTLDDSAVPGFVFFEHEPAQTIPPGNSVFYTVTWTSPASATNPIKMYAAANLANDNNSTDGDRITLTNVQGNMTGGPITVDLTGTNVSCFDGEDGSATATPSGGGGPPYFYEWSNGGTTQTIDNLFADTYTVTVTNSSGGMGTGSITITQPASELLVSISSQTNITCSVPTGSATAAASGGTPGYTYSWSTGASGATVSLPEGTHTVTATDDNDCTATTSVTITSNTTPPTASISASGATTFCEGGSVTLTASGGNSYSWSTGATTAAITVSITGTYTVTATAANGCTDTESQLVTVNPLPTASITPNGTTTFCAGGFVMLTASGGVSYVWSTGAMTAAITVSNAGTYTVTATDANGCTDTESQVVTVNPLPTASITPNGATTFCAGGSVMLTASGGVSYVWSTGAMTAAITVSNSGTYIVTATDANGCTDTESQLVTVNSSPTASISGASSICSGETITLTASGGISFSWNTGATTASISVSATATYSVTATDANGCTDDASHVVSATDPLACDDDGDTFSENGGDCNDANPAIFPGAMETCNSLDDDCDTQIDEGVLLTFFQDSDGDTYGNAAASIQACSAPSGYVANDDDCNDANSAINPAASEVCNNVDDDCSGSPEAATNTWTGNGDGVNWTDEGNWSDGIVPLSCQDVVIPAGKTVTIAAGVNAVARTLDVALGAILQVDLTATLDVEN